MDKRKSRELDRKKLLGDPILVLTIIALILFLVMFIAYPLFTLLVDSVYYDKKFLWTRSSGFFARLPSGE